MKYPSLILPVAAALLAAGQVAAQNETDTRAAAEAAERRALEVREEEVSRRLEEAEARMAEAARQIAELTTERLPQLQRFERYLQFAGDERPRLGVSIDGGGDDGPVEGVQIVGVTPGSAADDAGMRAGDVITSVNGESMSADSADQANEKLLDFMTGVEEGDTLDIEYLRDGKVGTVEVEPRPVDVSAFAFGKPGRAYRAPAVPRVHIEPGDVEALKNRFVFAWGGHGLGDMELVELNEGLGRYFGTDEGLLVVRAPESDHYQLDDGDVIQRIDGRTPTSVRHAMRILGSYQAGESLKLEIMRDKKPRTLEIEILDSRSSMVLPAPAPAPRPAAVPAPPRPAPQLEST